MADRTPRSMTQEAWQRMAVDRVSALREAADEEDANDYLIQCREMCCTSAGGLECDAVRAIVWKDLVLGLGAAHPVPYLSQSIIKHERRQQEAERRAAAISASDSADSAGEDKNADELAASQAPPTPRSNEARSSTPSHSTCHSRTESAAAPTNGGSDGPACRAAAAAATAGAHPSRRRAASLEVRKSGSVAPAEHGTPEGRTAGWRDSLFAAAMPDTGPRPLVTLRLPENCQARVVEADIQRSLWSLYPEATERDAMRRRLKDMLLRVLANNPSCYYYQGLHELMGFIMFVLTPHMSGETIVSVCEGLLRTRWASFSEETLSSSEALLYAMHAVIAEGDPHLAMALERCGVAPESHYAVSWVITWFSHSVTDNAVLGRLFDFFIVDDDGLGVVFFTAAFVVSQRDRILHWIADAEADAREMGSDAGVVAMACVYAQLTKMPTATLATATVDEVAAIIRKAGQYRKRHLGLALQERDNFIGGKVRKLGYLANARTRNAALRLLWSLLPREWRNPAGRRQGVSRMILVASVVLATAMVVMSAKDNRDGLARLFR